MMNRGFIAAAALIAGALLFTACRKGIAMNGPEGGPGVPQTSAVPKGSSPEGTWRKCMCAGDHERYRQIYESRRELYYRREI